MSGYGERKANKNSMVIIEKAAPVTRATLRTNTGPVPADSQQGTPSIRNYLRDLMNSELSRWRLTAYYVDTVVVESGMNPASKHQIQPECGDGRTCIARPSSQARTGTGVHIFSHVQLTTCRIGNHTGLIHTLLKVEVLTTVHQIVWPNKCGE